MKIFTVQKSSTGYQVTSTETISLIKNLPNHNDDGSINTAVTSRQVTGLLVTGTAAEPIIYVGSSDPRIATNSDSGLDTNSGILSRLTLTSTGQWDKVDIVRGLPRSEENHSINGLQYDAATNQLYVAVGGNTNMGAPSNSFGYLPEYAYSAAILKVDLNAIENMSVKLDTSASVAQKYIYDLPTLNDPTRADASETIFGGNDGLNMAKIVAGSPVQVYSPGYRNPYDFVLASSGKMYVMDNGPNQGWGGVPASGPNGITNQAVNGGVTAGDTLHLAGAGYYGGHPNPIRANGSAAGLTDSDGTADGVADGALMPAGSLPSDFAQVVALKNAKEATYKHPGGDAPALWVNGQSTNGLAEYTAGNFNGELAGDLFTVGYGGTLYRLDLSSDGRTVQAVNSLSIGGTPLDVIAQGADQPFAGTIWVSKYGADSITILEPESSATPQPNDDDDGDGLSNTIDRFAMDAGNGMATQIRAGETLSWSLSAADPATPGPRNSLFSLGFTGLMVDLSTPYAGLYDIENLTPGGAAGVMTIDAVAGGTARGNLNTQREAFQFGVTPAAGTNLFTITSEMDNPFDTIAIPQNNQSQGIYIGAGEQKNYLQITAHANGGAGGIEVLFENNDAMTSKMYAASGLITAAGSTDRLSLSLDVNVSAGLVTPKWTYTTGNGASTVQGQGDAVAVSGDLLTALRGAYTVNSKASGLAVGLISTSAGEGGPFAASWDNIRIAAPAVTATTGAAAMKITPGGGLESSTYNANSFEITNSGQQNIVSVTFDTRTNALPGIVFDPAGTAGDTVAKNLKIDTAGNTGAVQPAATDYSAFSVANGGGYNVMKVSFNSAVGGGFNPGETVKFSVDIDPLNIKNSGVSGDAGSISGLELTGSKVTVAYADGTTQTTEIIGDGSQGGAEAAWSAAVPTAPTLTLAGRTSGEIAVTSAGQTVQVTGTPNTTATVMIMTGSTGNNVQPTDIFDANKAAAIEYRQVALNSSGQGSFSFNVPSTNPVYLSAAIDRGTAGTGHVSAPLIVALQAGTTPPPSVVAINSGGAAYTDADTGIAYAAETGQYANGGSNYSTTHAITGTNDASLYSNQRYSTGNLIYNVPVASGSYEVTLKFAEIYGGITAAGQRVFDVRAEGALVLDDLDIFKEVGAYAAYDWTGNVNVTDGNLTLEFLKGAAENPAISAILIRPATTNPPPPPPPPPPSGVVAINSGGAAYTDADTGIAYAGETGQYANGGSNYGTTHAITGTNDASLYSNQRYSTGNLIYNVPVASGSYEVTLKFAEIYGGITAAGQRVFDVRAEGALVLDDLDIFKEVGAYAAYDWTGNVNVTDGNLTLEFLKGAAQNPAISAILIRPATTNPPADTTPPTGTGGASDLTTAVATHVATVTWNDSGSGLNASTIGTDDITVTGGASPVTVTNVTTAPGANGAIVASYTLSSASGFTSADNGGYTINRVAGAVRDVANNGVAAGILDTFAVNIPTTPPPDTTPPTGTGGANDVTTAVATHVATVTWNDSGSGLNASTIGTDDIAVTGGASPVTVTNVTTAPGANGAIVASYTLSSASGFTSADNGSYTINRVAGAVRDAANNGVAAGVLDTFAVNIAPTQATDTTRPTSTGGANNLTVFAATHVATITWSDTGSGVDKSSIDVSDIIVSGGPSVLTVTEVTTANGANGSIVATYKLSSAGGFDSADNGTYTINRVEGAVRDLANNGSAGGVQDSFTITIKNAAITGTAGNNTLYGGNGSDLIEGLAGNDVLIGRKGADFLRGGLGNDILRGDNGGDTLEGGGGADRFTYTGAQDSAAGSLLDVILDFSTAEGDKIDLSVIDASPAGGSQAFQFIGEQAFRGNPAELRAQQGSDGYTHVFADIDGNAVADFEIRIAGQNLLQSSDFIL